MLFVACNQRLDYIADSHNTTVLKRQSISVTKSLEANSDQQYFNYQNYRVDELPPSRSSLIMNDCLFLLHWIFGGKTGVAANALTALYSIDR
jgi:hypothetical protein